MSRAVLALLSLLWVSAAVAEPAPSPPPPSTTNFPDVQIVRVDSPVSIDGVLNEAVWQSAPAVTDFKQREPNQGTPGTQRTEVRVAYDDDAIYVGARMHDAHADSIVRVLSRRDTGGSHSDDFRIFLDPYHDRRSGYYFSVNAGGTLYDGTLFNDGGDDDSWDGVWDAKVKVDAEGWTAEMKIPFSQLRFPKGDVQQWGVNFQRCMGRNFEDDFLVYTPRSGSGFVSRFPVLAGLSNVTPGNAIEITPFATSKAEFLQHSPLDPFNDGSNISPNLGGDLRMSLGNKLTLNATVNPDFGQVEVDPAVVNLSDVETFFPEKRPFFVQGSSIFDAGQQGANDYWGFNYPQPTFFYSRRIGHAPQGNLPRGSEFADVPDGTTILGAAKVSGKLSEGLNFGMLHAATSRERAEIQFADLSRGRAEVEPLTYYGVGRVLKEFKERRNGLGVLTTVAARKFDDSRLENDFNKAGMTGVLDGWHFLDSNKLWVLSGNLAGTYVNGTTARITSIESSSRHYYQRPDAQSYSLDTDATSLAGSAGRVWLNKEKGRFTSNSAIGFISPGFELNDLGFMSRGDVINSHIAAKYKWTTPTKHVNNHNIAASTFASKDFDGNLIGAGVWSDAFWWYHNNWTLNLNAAYNTETVNPRRSRGGPLMLKKPGTQMGLFFDTDGSRKRYYYLSANSYSQPEENSLTWGTEGNFTYKPMSNLSVSFVPSYDYGRDGAFYFTSFSDAAATATYGRRYMFSTIEQETFSANFRLNIAFSPKMSLQFYGQPLVSSGKYSDVRELAKARSLDFVRQGEGSGSWTYDAATGAFDPDGGSGTASVGYPTNFNYKSLRGNAVFRWEYTPGAALYFVWTQSREGADPTGEFEFSRSIRQLGKLDSDNIFLVKATYYLNR